MSFYNMLNGVNQATFWILPMLELGHPDKFPRFRDCFVTEEKEIVIFTRVGSFNQGCGFGEEELFEHKNFKRFEDDDFDPTYGSYIVSVPKKWKKDFELILEGKLNETSKAYQELVLKTFPTIEDKIKKFFEKGEKNAKD